MCTVIIADKNLIELSELQNDLIAEGYNILLAEDGLEVFNLAILNHPQLIITDIDIPNLDGFELLMALQISTLTSSIPIIFTGIDKDEQKIKLIKTLGAEGYFEKPFKTEEVLELIKKLQIKKAYLNKKSI